MKRIVLVLALSALLLAVPGPSMATDGYFPVGYGTIAGGMAGAATAVTEDAFGGANNPATMVWAGDRLDVGIEWFMPRRTASRFGASFPSLNGSVDSGHNSFFDDTNNFLIPFIGFNRMLGKNLSAGVTVYGNGGMNTDYPQNSFDFGRGPSNILGGNGRLGVDLMQLIVAPTLSWRFHPNHSIGVAPLLAYQRFKADGLDAFAPFSSDPANLTNRGYDNSTGVGVRLGYYGRLTDWLSIGGAWSSRVSMGRFGKYSGLFAQHGAFDLPENYNVGIALHPAKPLLVALDYQHIGYGSVKAVGNPMALLLQGNRLGDDNGPGFGWRDVDVFKLGVQYKIDGRWTIRGGYAHCNNPVTPANVTINILAPGVITDHLTLGATYHMGHDAYLNAAYMHAMENAVSGPSMFNTPGRVSGATETVRMHQDSFGLSFSKRW